MHSSRSSKVLVTVAAILGLVLAACGNASTVSPPAEDDDHTSFGFGQPGDGADSDRTVEIEALDRLAFDPPNVAVNEGETVTFVVTNSGNAVHEFVIGDDAIQAEHAEEMSSMGDMGMQPMADEANAIRLAPGETKSITWHFTQAGQLQFACHLPGHYQGGMWGEIEVSTSVAAPQASTSSDGFTSVPPAEFAALMDDPQTFAINVHVPLQHQIPGTDAAVPFDAISEASVLPSDRSTRIAVYCRSGAMSTEAARTLASMGYTNVWELDGGMNAWTSSGRQLEPA